MIMIIKFTLELILENDFQIGNNIRPQNVV